MRIAIPREAEPEPRVAATPDTVKKMKGLGADVAVEAGAGIKSGILDSDYEAAGASVHASAAEAVSDADVVLKVRRPSARRGSRNTSAAPSSSPSWILTAMRRRFKQLARSGRLGLRNGIDAAHHPRAVDGRAVESRPISPVIAR